MTWPSLNKQLTQSAPSLEANTGVESAAEGYEHDSTDIPADVGVHVGSESDAARSKCQVARGVTLGRLDNRPWRSRSSDSKAASPATRKAAPVMLCLDSLL